MALSAYEAFQRDLRKSTPKSGPQVPNMGGLVPPQHQATPRTPPSPGLDTNKVGRPADMSKPLTPTPAAGQITGASGPLLVPQQLGGAKPAQLEFDLTTGKFLRR